MSEDEDIIYIVSGVMRTGTSMMMQALQAGGMDIAYHPSRDTMNTIKKVGTQSYMVNPHGFFEFIPSTYERKDFPKGYEGQVVKCIFPRILQIPEGNYKIILMTRDVREIMASWAFAFDLLPESVGLDMLVYDQMMKEGKEVLEKIGAEVTVLQYEEVLRRPKKNFQKLVENGWPIHAKKAAGVVDVNLHRVRKDND